MQQINIRRLAHKLEDENWEVRKSAIAELKMAFTWESDRRIVHYVLQALQDKNWHVRYEAASLFNQRGKRSANLRYSLNRSIKPLVLKTLIHALEDEYSIIRKEVTSILGKTRDPQIMPWLLKALKDPDEPVSKEAAEALQHMCTFIPTIVFRNASIEVFGQWSSVKQSHLTKPGITQLPLRTLVIYADTCNMCDVEAFTEYVLAYISEKYCKETLTIHLYGDPLQLRSDIYAFCSRCKQVEVYIEQIVFDTENLQKPHPYIAYNPDVSEFPFSMFHLKQLVIQTETYDFHQVERFLTYAVNSMGQGYLKKYVDVHLYGKPENLHSNLRNSLTNLCRHVYEHGEDESVGSMRSDMATESAVSDYK